MKFVSENYIHIPGFAITEMHLKGSELLCWSLIYGFTQDGESTFFGSLEYLASAINITIPNTKAVLDRLKEKGFIEKEYVTTETGRGCRYKAILLKQKEDITETVKGDITETVKNNKYIDNKTIYTPLISPQGETSQESISKNKKFAKAKPTPQVPLAPLPYHSAKFNEVWEFLCSMPKWKNKTNYALNLSIRKLSQVTEAEAIGMIEEAIEKGWQGIFLPKDKQQSIRKPKYVDIKDIM